MKRLGHVLVSMFLFGSPLLAERVVKVEALSTDTTTFRQNRIQLGMVELAAQLLPYQSAPDLSAYALLAGDADGQVIQGRTGANAARVDIGETSIDEAKLIGGGATSGFIKAYTDGVFASSPDSGTSFGLYDGAIEFEASADGTPETTSYLGVSTSGMVVEIQDGLQQYEVTATSGFNFAGTRFRINVPAPTNANDACFAGMIAWDSSYFYVCIATDTWVRVAMASW